MIPKLVLFVCQNPYTFERYSLHFAVSERRTRIINNGTDTSMNKFHFKRFIFWKIIFFVALKVFNTCILWISISIIFFFAMEIKYATLNITTVLVGKFYSLNVVFADIINDATVSVYIFFPGITFSLNKCWILRFLFMTGFRLAFCWFMLLFIY